MRKHGFQVRKVFTLSSLALHVGLSQLSNRFLHKSTLSRFAHNVTSSICNNLTRRPIPHVATPTKALQLYVRQSVPAHLVDSQSDIVGLEMRKS